MTVQNHFVVCPNLGEFALPRNQPRSLRKPDLLSPMGGLASLEWTPGDYNKNENFNLSKCNENYSCQGHQALSSLGHNILFLQTCSTERQIIITLLDEYGVRLRSFSMKQIFQGYESWMLSTPWQGEISHPGAASLDLCAQVGNWAVYSVPYIELVHMNYFVLDDRKI